MGLISVFLLPFGFEWVSGYTILYALWGGALFSVGVLLFYLALHNGEASGAVIAIGGLSPVATLFFSYLLLGSSLATYELASFLFLIAGSFLLSFTAEKGVRLRVLFFVVGSAVLFGYSNIVSKQVFDVASFITGFFWLKIGGVLVVLLFLGFKPWREAILHPAEKSEFSHKGWYFANRAYAGIGSVLIYYAIALGVPPLVDAMQATRFLFVFLGGWMLLRETFRGKILFLKISALIVISAGVLLLGFGDYLKRTIPNPDRSIQWGVTFSQKFSSEFQLGARGAKLGWQEMYDAILDDLGVRHLRLIAYWDLLEPNDNQYDFSGLDYQMRRAEEVGADVILVVGKKVPRWPECHIPSWAREFSISSFQFPNKFEENLLEYEKIVVERYKNSPALRYWQVENEPFLPFGECATVSRDMVDAEIALVRSLDSYHTILTSDSGEFGLWYAAAKRGDVFGTTMYRRVYNSVFGFVEYPIGPAFFRAKEKIIRFLLQDYEKEFLVVELGMEPWLPYALRDAPLDEQFRVFDFPFFQDTVRYAQHTDFDEFYLWGAEWWYWLKETHGDDRFWNEAKGLFN